MFSIKALLITIALVCPTSLGLAPSSASASDHDHDHDSLFSSPEEDPSAGAAASDDFHGGGGGGKPDCAYLQPGLLCNQTFVVAHVTKDDGLFWFSQIQYFDRMDECTGARGDGVDWRVPLCPEKEPLVAGSLGLGILGRWEGGEAEWTCVALEESALHVNPMCVSIDVNAPWKKDGTKVGRGWLGCRNTLDCYRYQRSIVRDGDYRVDASYVCKFAKWDTAESAATGLVAGERGGLYDGELLIQDVPRE